MNTGNADTLGTELLESLLKMAPTKEEERKLKEYNDDSPFKLGPAERFLREVLDIPFAFKRVEVMLYIANFETEVEYLKRSFETLEVESVFYLFTHCSLSFISAAVSLVLSLLDSYIVFFLWISKASKSKYIRKTMTVTAGSIIVVLNLLSRKHQNTHGYDTTWIHQYSNS